MEVVSKTTIKEFLRVFRMHIKKVLMNRREYNFEKWWEYNRVMNKD